MSKYDNQNIFYRFEITDIADNLDSTKNTTIKVDATAPKILKFDNWTSGRYGYFNMTINEINFDVVQYIDNSASRPSWRTLCSSLKKDVCYKKLSLSTGQHNVFIRVLDDAGNSIEKEVKFTI